MSIEFVEGVLYLALTFVPDVDNWYNELKSKKDIRITEPPKEDLEGLRMMTVVDPDGNQLRICTRV